MKKIGLIALCLVLLLSGFFYMLKSSKNSSENGLQIVAGNNSDDQKFSSWKAFQPRSRLFKVLLPNTPQYAKDFVPIPASNEKKRFDMYASEKIDGTLFLINVITYPSESYTTESLDILKQTVNELMQSKSDNKLKKLEDKFFKARQSLDFGLENQEYRIEGKIFMDGKVVYVLSYASRKKDFDSSEFEYFINSFELL